MPIIRPSADLRQKYGELSRLCHETKKPVNITVNGREDLVLLANDVYDALVERIELMSLLNEGLDDVQNNRLIKGEDIFDAVKIEVKKA